MTHWRIIYPSSVIRRPSSVVRRPSSVVRPSSSSVIRRPSSVVNVVVVCPSSSVKYHLLFVEVVLLLTHHMANTPTGTRFLCMRHAHLWVSVRTCSLLCRRHTKWLRRLLVLGSCALYRIIGVSVHFLGAPCGTSVIRESIEFHIFPYFHKLHFL